MTMENYSRNVYVSIVNRRLLRCEWQCLTFHSHGNFNLNFSIPSIANFHPLNPSIEERSKGVQMREDLRVVFDGSFPLPLPSSTIETRWAGYHPLLQRILDDCEGLDRRVVALLARQMDSGQREWLVKNDRSRS